MENSPIAIFVYNRPDHTRRMLDSLLKNPEASQSKITVYCDGEKNHDELENVSATRTLVKKILPGATIVERKHNLGLANSIISGVTEQCNKFGRVIVFEDDLVLSPVTLRYLNNALEYYADNEKVMHISAYMFPVMADLPPAFFYREATCWGWATWKRAWEKFEADTTVINKYITRNKCKKHFNINNTMRFHEMLLAHENGKLDSWAVRWYGSMYMHKGLALHPGKSLVQNSGFDGSGIHCNQTSKYDVKLSSTVPEFPQNIIEDQSVVKAMSKYRGKFMFNLLRGRVHETLDRILNSRKIIK